MTAQWPPAHRQAYAGLFHALPLAWGADPPPQDPDPVAASTYYEERLPAQMRELAAHLGEEQKFDAIIVDEARTWRRLVAADAGVPARPGNRQAVRVPGRGAAGVRTPRRGADPAAAGRAR